MISKPGWRAPPIGIWRTADGGRRFVPAAMPVSVWVTFPWGRRHERHSAGRGIRHATESDDLGCIEAVAAGLRQADGLLPVVDADARRHPGHPGDFHSDRPATVPTAVGGWRVFWRALCLCRTTASGGHCASLSDWTRLDRWRGVRPGSR